mmetsp:Transcript_50549/g.130289  ORF Transcript_50549/g.130289 Transcript_50549/m.130289 type:complete len:389 (-) Transcript_50549:505-1671(-)
MGANASRTRALRRSSYEASEPNLSIEDFQLLKVLGDGGYGRVFLAKRKETEEIFAIKIMRKKVRSFLFADVEPYLLLKMLMRKDRIRHVKSEREVLESVDHPFIIRLRHAFQTSSKLYLVMDFIPGGDLYFHINKEENGYFSEDRARFYAAELVLALDYLHQSHIIYRDLKLENIILDEAGHIKLVDFGLCKDNVEQSEIATSYVGTAEYLAPEMITREGHNRSLDWWGLGIILYEMLVGIPPFYSPDTKVMKAAILKGKIRFPPHISFEARSLVEKLLARKAEDRLGAGKGGAEEIKRHPFFLPIDWHKLETKDVRPPFVPPLSSGLDTSQFDPTFTGQTPHDSPASPPTIPVVASAKQSMVTPSFLEQQFEQFTFKSKNEVQKSGR